MYACDYACIYSLVCVNVCGHMSVQVDLSVHVHGHSPRKYVHAVDKWVYMGMCVYVQDSVSMCTHLYVVWSAHVSAHGHVSVVPVDRWSCLSCAIFHVQMSSWSCIAVVQLCHAVIWQKTQQLSDDIDVGTRKGAKM